MKTRTKFILSSILVPAIGSVAVAWVNQPSIEGFAKAAQVFYPAWIIMNLFFIGPSEIVNLLKTGEFKR